jgi:hypothetical protein
MLVVHMQFSGLLVTLLYISFFTLVLILCLIAEPSLRY